MTTYGTSPSSHGTHVAIRTITVTTYEISPGAHIAAQATRRPLPKLARHAHPPEPPGGRFQTSPGTHTAPEPPGGRLQASPGTHIAPEPPGGRLRASPSAHIAIRASRRPPSGLARSTWRA